MANRNTLWANVFVDALARSGLQAVCIAPGSRSTPLTLAFAQHDAIRVYTHLDERSAAFFALGLALASDEPVALVCTSGTAAANFYPAIIEAHMSRVPLLVLTTDRPSELRHSGANQTIDQVKMFGDHVLWAVDAGLPEADPSATVLRNLQTLALRAYTRANGQRKGVVHINMPFRKPLEPTPVPGDMISLPADAVMDWPMFDYHPVVAPTETGLQQLAQILRQYPQGMIVCGGRSQPGLMSSVQRLAQATGYVLLAEGISNVRHGGQAVVLGAYDTFLPFTNAAYAPDVVLRFGSVPLSQTINNYLEHIRPQHRLHISASGEWMDDTHRTSALLPWDEVLTCESLVNNFTFTVDPTWGQYFQRLEDEAWVQVRDVVDSAPYFDGAVAYDVLNLMPEGATLLAGNSMPVRLLDQFGPPSGSLIMMYANRGASGIDGNISTALGVGAARPDYPLVALVGDVTFYHDMNGLLAVQRNGVPVTIVLLNNNGGGIFQRLPIRDFEPEFTDLFVMPHGLQFEHAARLYGLDYVLAEDRDSFRMSFSESVTKRISRIIEVRTTTQHDMACRQQILAQARQVIEAISERMDTSRNSI